MKKLLLGIALALSAPCISAPAPMIINRTGQPIGIIFMDNKGKPLFTTGAITLTSSDTDHTKDQMVVIPSSSIQKPGSSPATKYQVNAASANITIGSSTLTILSFAPNTSYVITTGPAAGTFIANAGLATYDTISGTAVYGNPSPQAPGSGF